MNGRGRWKYALLQIKRGVKVMPRILGMTLILGLLISLFGWQMIKSRMSDEGNSQVKIGVVGDVESQLYLRMGLYYLQNLDESQFSIEFIQMTEEEAQEALLLYGMAPLYARLPRDAVLLAAIWRKIHDLQEVNGLLLCCGQASLVEDYE